MKKAVVSANCSLVSAKSGSLAFCSADHIDPLGENGEFHTIVVDSPLYSSAFKIKAIERITEKDMTYLRLTLSE